MRGIVDLKADSARNKTKLIIVGNPSKIIFCLVVACVFSVFVSDSLLRAEDLSEQEITKLREEAVARAKGGDIATALSQLEKLYHQKRDDVKVIVDYIVLLTWAENWPKAVAIYEENKVKDLPFYVLPEVAKAYRYASRPERGIELYEKYLNAYPQDDNSKLGIARILIDMRAYERARKYITKLIAEHPLNIEFYLLKSDLFITQNRLSEANDVLVQAKRIDPENITVQAILAQVYLWRGWPLKSLALFTKLYEKTKDNVLVNNGYANALNAAIHKKEARKIITELHAALPDILNYKRTKREFAVEEMPGVRSSIRYGHEMQGEDELVLNTRFDYPLAYYHTFFTNFVRRMITQGDTKNDILNKLYLGDQWQPNNLWRLIGAVTEYLGNKHVVGGMGQIVYTPNDYWAGSFYYESKIPDVPLRSRAEGTSVDERQFSVTFRPSDLFNSKGGIDFQKFSDGNRSRSYFWYTDSRVVAREKWSLHVGSEVYYSTFSKQDVNYFAPRSRSSVYVIPMLEHVWNRKNNRAFIERYYAGAGQVWQRDFGARNIGFARYEHDYTFTDTFSVVIGVAYYWNSYDGVLSKRLNADSAIRIRF